MRTSPATSVVLLVAACLDDNWWPPRVHSRPSTIYAWGEGNAGTMPEWTGRIDGGEQFTSVEVRRSGTCPRPFGQDVGSIHARQP